MTANSQQTTTEDAATTTAALPVGTTVEVRSRFDRRWARGFSIAAVARDAYQLRRLSDGSVLPAWFPHDEIRRTALS
jgi:hypothetical protein